MTRGRKSTKAEVEKRLVAIKHVQGSTAHLAPGRSLADELVEERRAGREAPRDGRC